MKNFSFLQRMFLLLFVGISMFAVQSCNEEELERKPFVGAWARKLSDNRSEIYEFKSDGTFKEFILFEETKTGIYSYNENLQTLTFSYSDGSTYAYILTTLSDNYFVMMSQKTASSFTYHRRDVDPKGLYDTYKSEKINGHEVVDLGLSVKWATCNIGSSSWVDQGDYFAWAETSTKSEYEKENYKWGDPYYNKWGDFSGIKYIKYCTDSNYGTVDNKTTIDKYDDAAAMKWGGSWRMPTKKEAEELLANCSYISSTRNGVQGGYFLAKNGNYIFMPNSYSYKWNGYWTSTLDECYSDCAYVIYFDNLYSESRCNGYAIRPVCK